MTFTLVPYHVVTPAEVADEHDARARALVEEVLADLPSHVGGSLEDEAEALAWGQALIAERTAPYSDAELDAFERIAERRTRLNRSAAWRETIDAWRRQRAAKALPLPALVDELGMALA